MSIIPDVDGLSLIFGKESYDTYHHTVGHSLLFAALTTAIAAFLAKEKAKCAALSLISFHAHLLSDLLGSGADWTILYLWPRPAPEWRFSPPFVWELSSWQNSVITALLLAAVAIIAVRKRRTFIEFFSEPIDARVVATIQKWTS